MDNKILITRSNINCSALTGNEFATMMIEDIKAAKEVYDSIWYHIELEKHNKYIESHKEYCLKRARAYAEKRWKTEKRRNEYIENELNNITYSKFHYCSIEFFDFDVCPWKNGISGNCILSYDRLTEDVMIRCFEEIKDNKYFKAAKGWILEDHHNGRPQIKLILNDEMETAFEQDKKTLSDAIAKFYEGCTYWGD